MRFPTHAKPTAATGKEEPGARCRQRAMWTESTDRTASPGTIRAGTANRLKRPQIRDRVSSRLSVCQTHRSPRGGRFNANSGHRRAMARAGSVSADVIRRFRPPTDRSVDKKLARHVLRGRARTRTRTHTRARTRTRTHTRAHARTHTRTRVGGGGRGGLYRPFSFFYTAKNFAWLGG